MDYGQLHRFVQRHGPVSAIDSRGQSRMLPSGDPDIHDVVEHADRFLWDGHLRSRQEMEQLIEQSERGLVPGCADCERLENAVIRARELDRQEQNLDRRHGIAALRDFQEHRRTHE